MLETSYKKSANIVSRKIAEETVLVPIRQTLGEEPSIYTLNEVGARIWELIDGSLSICKIRDRVASEFDVDPEVVEKDLLGLLSQLKEIGLVQEEEA